MPTAKENELSEVLSPQGRGQHWVQGVRGPQNSAPRSPNPQNEDPSHQAVTRLSPLNTNGNDPKCGGHEMQEVDQTGQGVWLGPVRGGGERGTGTVAAGTAVAGWPGHSNLRSVRPLRTRGKDLRQMRCQRRPRPEVSSVRVASPSPAKPQSPQTALRPRRGSGTRVLSPAAALQSPDPGGERVNPGGARSGPIFRGMHSLPPTNPLREPSPLPSPPLLTPGAAARSRRCRPTRAGIESEMQAQKAKRAGPQDEKKTGGRGRIR